MSNSIGTGFAAACIVAALAAPVSAQSSSTKSKMPTCAGTDAVVWYEPSSKTYVAKGNAGFGHGTGSYVCRSQAEKRGAKLSNNQPAHQGEAMNQGSAPSNPSNGMTTGSNGSMSGSNATNTSGKQSQAQNNGPATTGTTGGAGSPTATGSANPTNTTGQQSQSQNNGGPTTGIGSGSPAPKQ